ncbi:hypothetical protein H4582DRAFT_1909672 [Lactarius indigo]|nr:hypothetical protein H4582DRAFT_1909672 [Lactarius indigo]
MSSPATDCGLALAHLILPALTSLCLVVNSHRGDGSDVRQILPYVARHAYGPQDAQPLQSMLIYNNTMCCRDPCLDPFFDSMHSARVALSITNDDNWSPDIHTGTFSAVMEALPLEGLWPLLQRVRLTRSTVRGFREMLLEDDEGRENPLLPLLTTLAFVGTALIERRTLLLCDALMKRVEQEVPLEVVDLRKCLATSGAVELLSEIVVDVLGPEKAFETGSQMLSESVACRLYLEDEDSTGIEDYEEEEADSDSDTGSDDEERVTWGIDDDYHGYDDGETVYWLDDD